MHLVTSRLVIRSFEESDVEAWLELVNDPAVTRFLPPGPDVTPEMFRTALERRQKLEREHRYSMWATDLKATGKFIGQCGLFPVEGKGPEVELAYHFSPASWRNGYATEAVRAVLAYGFERIGLDRVLAVIMPENFGSQRVVEKAGMRFDGTGTFYEIEGLKKYVAERDWWKLEERRDAR